MNVATKGLLFFATITLLFLMPFLALQLNAETDSNLTDISKKIEEYQKEITRLKGQATSLSNQIAQFDVKIKITEAKITQTQEKIDLLTGRIGELKGSITSLSDAFALRAGETYEMTRLGEPLYLVLSSSNLNEALFRYHYLKKAQDSDRELLVKLRDAHDSYKLQQDQETALRNELDKQKKELDTQKVAKARLLSTTKNDEKKYQSLLSQALAEKAAIEKALVSGVKVGPVKAGDPIAFVGNSGYPSCSTGKHLHFEVRKNNVWTDPTPYLSNKSVNDEERGGTTAIGSGSWQWPISDTIRLTQHYGHTPWSWRYAYSGQIHTGFDMVSTSSDVIKAPADGNLFKSSEKCGSSTINIVYIEHGNGVISFYLHVQ